MEKKKILIVEDNEINREILKEILLDEYTVIEAENGKIALDILHECGEEISLILLDIMMPVMDGYTFLEHKKAASEFATIPVIVMTQGSSEEDEINALVYGATDFVPKPYRAQVILHRIASIINLRETAAMVNQLKYDRLTGLYTKEYFCQHMRQILRQNPEKDYDIVCCNIENFKLFNDAFGVSAGDRLLRQMAEYFEGRKHESAVLGRYQSDRFVWMIERTPIYRDEKFLELNKEIQNLPDARNLNFKWGIYRIIDRSLPTEQMCDRAMLAVNSIKGQYLKLFAVYDELMRDQLLREQEMVENMAPALERGEFEVHFQPKYSLSDGKMAGAEALVRWNHPEKGMMGPGEFIPLFERNGFITRLDYYVWEQVCKHLKEWKDLGYPMLPISVNVSRADFYQVNLPEILQGLIQKYDLEPEDLHLEITESAYMDDPKHIMRSVETLRECGFVIELDDFGSGFSSLNMMNQMELDIVKLDMKFIQNEMLKPTDQGILRFVVNLVHWKKLKVVAEGIETREQMERVKMMGCDLAQGYFFSKPVVRKAYEKMLEDLSSGDIAMNEQKVGDGVHGQYILVIDEDPDYRNLLKTTFEGEYDVLFAEDAQEVIENIAGREMLISVVIVSMTLPEDKSFEILNLLKDYRELWMIPILATGTYESELEKAALQLGADDFSGKSADMYSLQKRTERLIGMVSYDKKKNQLQNEVFRDYLTGLLNRRGLNTAFHTLTREDLPLAVYFFDLDNLKEINDHFGHETGDRILKMFAELLRQQTRNTDIIARYGGDEFVVILKHVPSEQFVLNKGNEICDIFNSVKIGENIFAASSAGVVLCENNEKPTIKLLKQADQALYRAKAEKKGKCCMWNAGEVER